MREVPATEFTRNFGQYREIAQREPVAVTRHGRATGYFVSVVEFEENRRIAWQTGPEGFAGRLMGGRIWRYELDPQPEGTLVRESWDISPDPMRVLLKLGDIYSNKTKRDMERTLGRLAELMASGSGTTS